MVVGLGAVSLASDMVADGGISLFGPLLGALGASALVIGLVTGGAEAVSLLLRLVSGPLADRAGNHWGWTIVGYGMTAVCIPLLAVTPFLGGAGLLVAAVLILSERAGKAFRSPAKTAILAHAAGAVGRGRGFGVHKAMDQTGAFLGPLLVSAIVASSGLIWPALLWLAVPGAVAMALLVWLRFRWPNPAVLDQALVSPASSAAQLPAEGFWRQVVGAGLPRPFFWFAAATGLTTAGLVSYGILSFDFTRRGLISLAVVPLVFAAAMAAGAFAAVVNGWQYDRFGPSALLVLPLLVAAVPPLTLVGGVGPALTGMVIWGFATGLQDSTIKALVADMVAGPRRATAYGVFAAIQGLAALLGGAAVGALYDAGPAALIWFVAVTQAVALLLLVGVLRSRAQSPAGR